MRDFNAVESLSVTIPFSARDILDFGIDDEDTRRWAQHAVLADDVKAEREWMALPLRVRAWRVLSGEVDWAVYRFTRWLHQRMFGCEL